MIQDSGISLWLTGEEKKFSTRSIIPSVPLTLSHFIFHHAPLFFNLLSRSRRIERVDLTTTQEAQKNTIMTRGRRPDAGLEPSRQLLTQRAFRQRRAAHLADLEEKISRLERENATLKGIEYVEQERGDRSMATKRMKSEASEGSQAGGWPDGQDVESETASSSCEMCAHHEREKEELVSLQVQL